MSLVMAELK